MRVRSMQPALSAALGIVALAGCMPSYTMTPELPPGRLCPGSHASAWYFPTGAADNERLERWCVTVGPPAVRRQTTAVFSTLGAGDDVTLFSWNVAAGGGDLRSFLEHEVALRCAWHESFLEPGAGHFVLLVQEAFRRSADVPESREKGVIPRAVAEESRPGGRPDILDVAEECGLSLAYVAAARNGQDATDGAREDRGVAIISTLPLDDVWFIELPYEAARRVAVAATVRNASGHGLRLVNVHFTSAPPPARMLITGNGSRLRQGLAVAEVLRQVEERSRQRRAESDGADLPTLLAGDFNTWSNSETTLRRLRELFPDSPEPLSQSTRGAFPTDHILFRRGSGDAPEAVEGSYARLDDRFHSDHHPVRIRIRFPAGGQPPDAAAHEHLAPPRSP
jgi:endonuclease/exonuclease/phosphatase family metal-dependent hydrolase